MEEERPTRSREGLSKWRTVKELLGLKALACCGSLWGSGRGHSNHMTLTEDEPFDQDHNSYIDDDDDDDEDEDSSHNYSHESQQQLVQLRDPHCLPQHQTPANVTDQEMDLAAALQAERRYRAASAAETGPTRVSLMRLLEAKGREEREKVNRSEEEEEGVGACCCVCMGSRKGAAFIPCGHTFCRACARELWLNRGDCPLCNRSILEILDIF